MGCIDGEPLWIGVVLLGQLSEFIFDFDDTALKEGGLLLFEEEENVFGVSFSLLFALLSNVGRERTERL